MVSHFANIPGKLRHDAMSSISDQIRTLLSGLPSKLEYVIDGIGLKNKYPNPFLDRAIANFKKKGGHFGNFALTEHSVRAFLQTLLSLSQTRYSILELGSGQSTLFLRELIRTGLDIAVTSYEHDKSWSDFVRDAVRGCDSIQIVECDLRDVDDPIWEKIFSCPRMASELWNQYSRPVGKEASRDTRMHNAFYAIPKNALPHGSHHDGMIVDGPHGNGRSLSFPLLRNYIRPGTIVLMDDYHHYPFLKDMARIFDYEILESHKHRFSNKGWALMRITDTRTDIRGTILSKQNVR